MIIAEKLKKAILQLAVQGKLVPQNSNDEPASILLKKIRAEKIKLIKSGKIKKNKQEFGDIYKESDGRWYEIIGKNKTDITDEIPFDIPDSWRWVRLGDISEINPRNHLDDNLNVSFIPMNMIKEGFENTHSYSIRKWKDVKSNFTHFMDNDVGIAKITPCFENRKSVIFHKLENQYGAGSTELHVVRLIHNYILTEYILIIIKTEYFISNGVKRFTGTAGQQRIGKKFIEDFLVPLPPLEEQKRIVEKIEKIKSIVDEYVKTASELHRLNEMTRKAILQLAVQGKLVPQNSNDEPASILLKKIRAEKIKLIKSGKIKKNKQEFGDIYKESDGRWYEIIGKNKTDITDEITFDIPDSWRWVRLGDISLYIQRGKSPTYSQIKKIPVVSQKCNRLYATDISQAKFIEETSLTSYESERFLEEHDLLWNSTGTGTVGRLSYYCSALNPYGIAVVDSHVTVIRLHIVFYKYVFFYLSIPFLRKTIECICDGSTNQKELSLKTVINYLVPLPPLEEQKRIVEKIERLFGYISEL